MESEIALEINLRKMERDFSKLRKNRENAEGTCKVEENGMMLHNRNGMLQHWKVREGKEKGGEGDVVYDCAAEKVTVLRLRNQLL
jgi:hypothetical protein